MAILGVDMRSPSADMRGAQLEAAVTWDVRVEVRLTQLELCPVRWVRLTEGTAFCTIQEPFASLGASKS